MGPLDFLANVMASHHYVTSTEAVERAASLWHGHPPADRSDITRAFAERPEMFTPESHVGDQTPYGSASGREPPPVVEPASWAGVSTPGAPPTSASHPDREKILQKVRDLIAVAIGHANDNEARAHAVIACKLIAEHDLLKPE